MEEQSVHRVFIGLGSNLGDRRLALQTAMLKIEEANSRILKSSGIYKSEAWGYQSAHVFYNQCIMLETILDPYDLLKVLKAIEIDLGRMGKSRRYTDRPIDLDILFYDDLHIESTVLLIPHPGIAGRNFVLQPLLEIAPLHIHPLLKRSIAELSELCTDQNQVLRLPDK